MASEYKPNFGSLTINTATATLSADGYGGMRILLDRAAGSVVTLPAATGSGIQFEIIIKTTVTSSAYDIRCPSGSEFFGHALLHQDSANTVVTFDAADNDNEISMNGTTTGGLRGGRIVLTDAYSGHWHVIAEMAATGTEASPFTTIA